MYYSTIIKNGTVLLAIALFGVGVSGAGPAFHVRTLAAAKGSITGTILLSDGSPANACTIKFFLEPDPMGRSTGSRDFRELRFLQTGKVVGSAMTNSKGEFTIKSIDVGSFTYMAGSFKIGFATGDVKVEEGKTATVAVKLDPPAGR